MSKELEAVRTWRRMIYNHNALKENVLELLRHPDATPEQLAQVRQTYIASHESMCKAQDAMLNKFGNWGVPRFNPKRKEDS